VANGDPGDLRTLSNIPHFFLKAGLRNGLLHERVVLHPERLRGRRLVWNGLRPLLLNRPRGWQYTRQYAERIWADRDVAGEVDEYISHYQWLPPRKAVSGPITYYIDGTLRYWLDDYGWRIGRRIRAEALAREREAFLASKFVVCMSRWCADDVISFYGVPEEKVRVVAPGANLDEEALPSHAEWGDGLSPLRLGLVGLDWEKKGGPILLDAAVILERMGYEVEVVVVGPPPERVPAHPALRRLGYISKECDLPRFVELIRSFHFGCLLSRVEAFGIAAIEYLRLGVPVIVANVGGIIDPRDAGLRFSIEANGEELANALADVLRDPQRYVQMRAAAARDSAEHSWDRTAKEMLALLEER
jgi:glycosyltransferase involved in cell wall biosynthesis